MAGADIAVAHWGESVNGGGERVAWELARAFDAPLYVSVRDPSIEPDDVEVRELFDGWTKRLAARGGVLQLAADQYGWEIADPLREYDTLVTSGNECLAYVPPPEQTWVHYTHHTSRRATDQLPSVRRLHGRAGTVAERLIRKGERQLYATYAQKPDAMVTNSDAVKRRIELYWGRDDVDVVYPPVPVEQYSRDDAETGDSYLVLSRLDWHKGIEDAIRTFANRDAQLVVAGDGDARDDLEAMATDNIHFAGYVSEQQKRTMYSRARAVINNAYAEDFGLTTVEPMAAGTPVIGVREGFTQHLVGDGRGVTYERGELDAAIDAFEQRDWSDAAPAIEAFAERFNTDRFAREMHAVVEQARDTTEVQPAWPTA